MKNAPASTPSTRPAPTRQGLAPAPTNDKAITYSDLDGNKVDLSIQSIKQYICPSSRITDAEAYMFLSLCQFHRLNPFTRDCYCVKYGDNPAQMVVGKETFTKRAANNPKFRGSKAGVIVMKENGELENRPGEIVLENETLIGGWAEVFVENYLEPIYASVGFRERCQYKDGKPASKWATAPALMIRKCALVAALREAFPHDLGNLYAPEEMGYEDVEATVAPIQPPDVQDVEFTPVEDAQAAEEETVTTLF